MGTYRLLSPAKIDITENSVLELNFSGEIPELPPHSPLAQFVQRDGVSLYELGRLLHVASRDPHIVAIHLSVHSLGFSWAQVEEVRGFLKEFRQSNKKIIASLSGDMAEEKDLYLVSQSDEIYLNPDAGLLINGLNVDVPFFKRTMEKLHIEPQMIMLKEYKNPETYTREKFTPEFRAMYVGILTDVQDRFIQTVADDRKISPLRLRAIHEYRDDSGGARFERGPRDSISATTDEVRTRLVAEQRSGSKEYRGITASKYLNAVRNRIDKKARHHIALLGGIGQIISGKSEDVWGEMMGGETMVSPTPRDR